MAKICPFVPMTVAVKKILTAKAKSVRLVETGYLDGLLLLLLLLLLVLDVDGDEDKNDPGSFVLLSLSSFQDMS